MIHFDTARQAIEAKAYPISVGVSAAFGGGLAAMKSNDPIWMLLWTVTAAALAALFGMIPRYIAARSQAQNLQYAENAQLIERIKNAYEGQLHDAVHERARIVEEKDRHFKISILERRAKHKLQSEIQRQLWRITDLEEKVRHMGGDPGDFHAVGYDEITRDIDMEILSILGNGHHHDDHNGGHDATGH